MPHSHMTLAHSDKAHSGIAEASGYSDAPTSTWFEDFQVGFS